MIAFLIVALAGGIVFYAFVAVKAPTTRGGRRPSRNTGRHSMPSVSLPEVKERWSIIKATSESGPAGLKNAINDADKLFDAALAGIGMPGETMADRLKAARPRFGNYSTYDGVWRAHKLRNSLAHDIGFDLVPLQAKEALQDFERGLRELGTL